MSTPRVELREADQPTLHRMPREVAAGLVAARIADVSPTFIADEYRVNGVLKVGVVRIAGHDVWIRSKTPVRRHDLDQALTRVTAQLSSFALH